MPLMASNRARFDPRRGRITGSIFGSPESQDRAAFLDEGMRNYDAEARRGMQVNPIQPVFDALKREELGAAYDGKKFGVGGMGGGVTTNRTAMTGGAMPARGARKPVDYLDGGSFDVTDDPRVQQAMTRQALDALDPRLNNPEAERGREMQDAALGRNATEQRNLRSARDYAMPMHRIKEEMGDISSEAEARRGFLPWGASASETDFNRKFQLATEPARLAAEGKADVAGITGQSRVDAARVRQPDQIELLIDALGQASRGGWGVDAQGRPLGPPPELQQRLRDLFMNQGAPQGAAPAGPPSRGGGAGPTMGATSGPPANPQPGQKYRLPNGKMAVWANDDGTWGWYEDDGG